MEENTVNTTQPAEAAGKATFDQVLQDPDYRRAFDERVRTAVSRRFRTVDAQRAQIRELAGEMAQRLGLAPGEDGQVDLDALREALARDSAAADRRIATPPLAARNDEDFGSCKDHQSCHSEEARRSDVGIRNDPGAAEKRIAPQGYLPPRAGSEIREEAGATAAMPPHTDRAGNEAPRSFTPGNQDEVSADDDEAPIRASFRRIMAEGGACGRSTPASIWALSWQTPGSPRCWRPWSAPARRSRCAWPTRPPTTIRSWAAWSATPWSARRPSWPRASAPALSVPRRTGAAPPPTHGWTPAT